MKFSNKPKKNESVWAKNGQNKGKEINLKKKKKKKIEFRFLEPKMGQEWARNTNFSNQNVLFPRG